MKIAIEIPDELLRPALERHLTSGALMMDYFCAALKFFNDMKRQEESGRSIGFSQATNKEHFERYNTIASPAKYLEGYN